MKTILVPLSGLPQRIVITSVENGFSAITAFGYSGFLNSAPVDNIATAYIGYETGRMPYVIDAGSYGSIECPSKQKDNLANLWVRGAVGDGLFLVVY